MWMLPIISMLSRHVNGMHKQPDALGQMTVTLSISSYKDDNGNQGDYLIVKCSSWLLHDKVASLNLELPTGN